MRWSLMTLSERRMQRRAGEVIFTNASSCSSLLPSSWSSFLNTKCASID